MKSLLIIVLSLFVSSPLIIFNEYQSQINQSIVLRDLTITEKGHIITSASEWDYEKKKITEKFLYFLGTNNKNEETELSAELLWSEEYPEYTLNKVSYLVSKEEKVSAYVMIPKEPIKSPIPAVLALHQTTNFGKDEVIGLAGDENFSYGLDLVLRGFVVMAPDALSAGERVFKNYDPYDSKEFYIKNPDWSMIGKSVWDNKKALDYLYSLDIVDKQQIGVIGHSEGGVDSLFLAAFDQRISAIAINCGLGTITGDTNPYKWARNDGFIAIPKLRNYLDKGIIPFDYHELVALIAPRPLISISMNEDEIFPHYWGIYAINNEVTKIYKIYNRIENLSLVVKDGNHSLPQSNKKLLYDWLYSQLTRT